MKCVICHSPNIVNKQVEEEFRINKDVILIPIEVMVCEQCGERYYNRATMKKLEHIEKQICEKKVHLEEVGRILKASTT